MLIDYLKKKFDFLKIWDNKFIKIFKPLLIDYLKKEFLLPNEKSLTTIFESNNKEDEELVNTKIKLIEDKLKQIETAKLLYEDIQNARYRDVLIIRQLGKNSRSNFLIFFILTTTIISLYLIFIIQDTFIKSINIFVLTNQVLIINKIYEFEFGSTKENYKNNYFWKVLIKIMTKE